MHRRALVNPRRRCTKIEAISLKKVAKNRFHALTIVPVVPARRAETGKSAVFKRTLPSMIDGGSLPTTTPSVSAQTSLT
jgi:hypothetical protein